MKVYLQIVDAKTGIYQTGMIDEPVRKGYEIKNAIEHFGSSEIEWQPDSKIGDITIKSGRIKDTSKVVAVICLKD